MKLDLYLAMQSLQMGLRQRNEHLRLTKELLTSLPVIILHFSLFDRPILSMQVRACMRASKEALRQLAPVLASSAATPFHASDDDADDSGEDDCIICLSNSCTGRFDPCGHCVTCSACAQLLLQTKQPCPVCRVPVLSVMS